MFACCTRKRLIVPLYLWHYAVLQLLKPELLTPTPLWPQVRPFLRVYHLDNQPSIHPVTPAWNPGVFQSLSLSLIPRVNHWPVPPPKYLTNHLSSCLCRHLAQAGPLSPCITAVASLSSPDTCITLVVHSHPVTFSMQLKKSCWQDKVGGATLMLTALQRLPVAFWVKSKFLQGPGRSGPCLSLQAHLLPGSLMPSKLAQHWPAVSP